MLLTSGLSHATGVVPDSSVLIIEQSDGEGGMNVKNSDSWPVLLLTTLKPVAGDTPPQMVVTPPAARVEPGKNQHVRFILTDKTSLKTEHLERVIFEGVPPQNKDQNVVRMSIRQNLPVLIRPAGLAKEPEPWKHLVWTISGDEIQATNPSPYVVRLSQDVKSLPDQTSWLLPDAFVLPGQTVKLKIQGPKKTGISSQVRISPASAWGYTVNSYDAALTR